MLVMLISQWFSNGPGASRNSKLLRADGALFEQTEQEDRPSQAFGSLVQPKIMGTGRQVRRDDLPVAVPVAYTRRPRPSHVSSVQAPVRRRSGEGAGDGWGQSVGCFSDEATLNTSRNHYGL